MLHARISTANPETVITTRRTTKSDDTNNKMKGLKYHKKAQKANQMAKRVAAAEKSKAQKTAAMVVVAKEQTTSKQTAVASEDVVVGNATTVEHHLRIAEIQTEVDADQTTASKEAPVLAQYPTITITDTNTTEPASTEAFDIHAHRKALEAALYENMETPKQMLMRLKFEIATDAEFHLDIEDDHTMLSLDGFETNDLVSAKCPDDE
ncbi:Nn.00g085850.m01.CDS01 [Neocucurbitaria sp. VM-36]